VIWFFTSVVDTGGNLVSGVVDNSKLPAAFTGVIVTGIKKFVTGICEHRAIF
jgi:hypothetical protein